MNDQLTKVLIKTLIAARYFCILGAIFFGIMIFGSILGILGIPMYERNILYKDIPHPAQFSLPEKQ